MVRVLAIALALVWVWSLAESLLTPRAEVRTLPKLAWVLIIVLLPPVGAFAWLALGRAKASASLPSGASGAAGHPEGPGRGPAPPRRPIRGPDDDPDFLNDL